MIEHIDPDGLDELAKITAHHHTGFEDSVSARMITFILVISQWSLVR